MDAVEEELEALRKAARMSWAEVARRTELDPVTIYRYRKGILRSDDTTYRLETLFKVSQGHLDAIAAGEEPPSAEPAPAPAGELAELQELAATAAAMQRQIVDLQRQIDAIDTDGHHRRRRSS